MLIDSHSHLNCLTETGTSLDVLMQDAFDAGVGHILCPGIDPEHFFEVLDIARQYDQVKAGVGVHPNETGSHGITEAVLFEWASDPEVIAIGETGLDYFRDTSDKQIQQAQFRLHIQVAKALKKPLIIHGRDAHEDILKIMQEEQAGPAIMHCFTESVEIAKAAIDLGCLISFSGIITFKNAQTLRDVVAELPLDRLLVETDAPYLAPEPYRGKMNQPAYVHYVAQCMADIKGIPLSEVCAVTSANFIRLFGWPNNVVV